MSAAVRFAPDGSDAWMVFNMRPGPYNQDSIIEFLEDLHEHLGDDKITLIWDGPPSHRSKVMKGWIRRATSLARRRTAPLEVAPDDLNPVELVWGNLKGSELANLCPDTIEEATSFAEQGLHRIGSDADVVFAFLAALRASIAPKVLVYYTSLLKPAHRPGRPRGRASLVARRVHLVGAARTDPDLAARPSVTLGGTTTAPTARVTATRADPGVGDLDVTWSAGTGASFSRLRVREASAREGPRRTPRRLGRATAREATSDHRMSWPPSMPGPRRAAL